MSNAHPYVSGKRVILPKSMRYPTVLGEFSCHWAAVAAMVRLHQPDFVSLSGDKPEDLAREPAMRIALEKALAATPKPAHSWPHHVQKSQQQGGDPHAR